VLNNQKIKMNYLNYETSIVSELKVKLVGWTKRVSFTNPSAIGAVSDLRKLRDDLKSGKCHWVQLTPSQLSEHKAMLDACCKEGETVGKARKTRSDKGKKRKSSDKENEQPRKRAKKRVSSHKSKHTSAAIIVTTDKEDSEDDG
jgi:hypothetical protein